MWRRQTWQDSVTVRRGRGSGVWLSREEAPWRRSSGSAASLGGSLAGLPGCPEASRKGRVPRRGPRVQQP